MTKGFKNEYKKLVTRLGNFFVLSISLFHIKRKNHMRNSPLFFIMTMALTSNFVTLNASDLSETPASDSTASTSVVTSESYRHNPVATYDSFISSKQYEEASKFAEQMITRFNKKLEEAQSELERIQTEMADETEVPALQEKIEMYTQKLQEWADRKETVDKL